MFYKKMPDGSPFMRRYSKAYRYVPLLFMSRMKTLSDDDFSKELEIEDDISLKTIDNHGVTLLIGIEMIGHISSSYIYFDGNNVDLIDKDRKKIAFFGHGYIGQIVREISDEGEEWYIQLVG